MEYLIKGIVIGIVFGIPVGAIGALTVRRTITYGVRAGLASGLGSSVSDVMYACLCVFGLHIVSDYMLSYQNVISGIGGVFVILMGIGIMRKTSLSIEETVKTSQMVSFFLSSFFIATTNPATILTFILAFSIFEIKEITTILEGMEVVSGIFIGTFLWWIVMTSVLHAFHKKITERLFVKINYVLGSVVTLFGAGVLVKLIF
ncbi:MAG: LysE family transporter [bacterium]|nr:LysE family transporter [bacterium]